MTKRAKPIHQAAVLAMHQGRICLVSSSSGKRWLLPKGHLEHDASLRETARQEAWEEAGIVGSMKRRPSGHYRFRKLGHVYRVDVFEMEVTDVKRKWPERRSRQRKWLRPGAALTYIEDPRLRRVVGQVISRKRAA